MKPGPSVLIPAALGAAVLGMAAWPTGAHAQDVPSPASIARAMAEVPLVGGVSLSPDGAWVTYRVTHRSVADNELRTEQRLRRVADGPEAAVSVLPDGAAAVRWCPDSTCLSLLLPEDEEAGDDPSGEETGRRFFLYDLDTEGLRPVPVSDTAALGDRPPPRSPISGVPGGYRWSPRGNFLAFPAPLGQEGGLDPRQGVPPDRAERWTRRAVFVLDLASGVVTQATPDSLHVAALGGFDWAPDEEELVVAVDTERNSQGKKTDLVVVRRDGSRLRPLVSRPAMDNWPSWSPDGRWIAFATHQQELSYHGGRPAVVPARGGAVISFPPESPSMGGGWWSPDGGAFIYVTPTRMGRELRRADLVRSEVTDVPSPRGGPHLSYDEERSVSADRALMAFVRSSPTTPPDLWVARLDPSTGEPLGPPWRLTRLADGFPLSGRVAADTLSWPAPDGRFRIHALLLSPAPTGEALLPLVLDFMGGPVMATREFAGDGWNGAHTALAARGYAVLFPNTRGREGYGWEFENAIRDERERARGPLADAMAGVDLLVEEGRADPDRVAVIGHSYGGYLTAYAVTRTDRFRAAVIHEGGPLWLTTASYFGNPPGGWRELLARDFYGIHDPFDSEERARIIEESPGLHAERVETPTLLVYGDRGLASTDGIPFYHALKRVGVPARLLLYDEAHVFGRPAAVADDLQRTLEWIDRWTRRSP